MCSRKEAGSGLSWSSRVKITNIKRNVQRLHGVLIAHVSITLMEHFSGSCNLQAAEKLKEGWSKSQEPDGTNSDSIFELDSVYSSRKLSKESKLD